MRIRWRGLELPTRVLRDEVASKENYGRFTIEPFERGFGTTVGNSIRRILLSSLQGAAVTDVKIKGVDHEFTSIPGVREDVTEVILNVKSLVVKSTSDAPKTVRVSVKGKSGETVEARASDIESDASIEIVNKDQLLATLTDEVDFEMEMTVALGRSYVTADENKQTDDEEDQIIGVIPVDSTFSPVTRVRYRVEDTRVGQRTNYDRLVMEIWTNGTLTPDMALVEAAKILRKHLNPFVKYFEMGVGLAVEGSRTDAASGMLSGQSADLSKLSMPISSLNLSVRSGNCLTAANVNTIGELLAMDESALLKLRSFGKTSMREVKRKLADYGLSLQTSDDDAEFDEDQSDLGTLDIEDASPPAGPPRVAPLDSGTMIRPSPEPFAQASEPLAPAESSAPPPSTTENEVEIANENGAK